MRPSTSFRSEALESSSSFIESGPSGKVAPLRPTPNFWRIISFSSTGRTCPRSPSSKARHIMVPSNDEIKIFFPSGVQARSVIAFVAMSWIITNGRGFEVFQIDNALSCPAQAITVTGP